MQGSDFCLHLLVCFLNSVVLGMTSAQRNKWVLEELGKMYQSGDGQKKNVDIYLKREGDRVDALLPDLPPTVFSEGVPMAWNEHLFKKIIAQCFQPIPKFEL